MKRKRTRKIEIPKGITPEEFYLRFVPETYRKNVKNHDMSGYKGIDLDVQFNITGRNGGEYGLKVMDGTDVETSQGKVADPVLTYTFSSKHFEEAVEGKYPWLPLDMAFDPEAVQENFTPEQAHEEMEILRGIEGQADMRVRGNNGEVVDLRMNFHGATEPAVVFITTEGIVEEIREKKYTVMEAFMAGKVKVEGPVEFAMHVMALAPEDEEDEEEED